MAEIALGVLERECLDRRIGDTETLKKEITAWKQRRNQHLKIVDWRFITRCSDATCATLSNYRVKWIVHEHEHADDYEYVYDEDWQGTTSLDTSHVASCHVESRDGRGTQIFAQIQPQFRERLPGRVSRLVMCRETST
jgi:hypothetical protein